MCIGGWNRVWRDFLTLKVARFEYRVGVSDSLKIVVNPSAKEAWMPWDPEIGGPVSKETRRAMARWKTFNGLGGLRRLPHVQVQDE